MAGLSWLADLKRSVIAAATSQASVMQLMLSCGWQAELYAAMPTCIVMYGFPLLGQISIAHVSMTCLHTTVHHSACTAFVMLYTIAYNSTAQHSVAQHKVN